MLSYAVDTGRDYTVHIVDDDINIIIIDLHFMLCSYQREHSILILLTHITSLLTLLPSTNIAQKETVREGRRREGRREKSNLASTGERGWPT